MSTSEHAPGMARSPGISYQELLATDTRTPPPALTEERPRLFPDQARVPVSRYTSRAYHELEKERLWGKVWQMACREEHVAAVGDTHVYEICGTSILIVRSAPDRIQAYYNACLHRGRKLRDEGGPAEELRCPFHGFCWRLDGSLRSITTSWDFPELADEDMDLPELRVGTWGGFVFVSMDPDGEPLEDHLAGLDEQFAAWPLDGRYVQVHVEKVIACNWKIAQDAFNEALHVVTTHPQRLVSLGDTNSQYDVWENFDRLISPNGTPSPHLRWEPTEQQMFDSMVDGRMDEPSPYVLPEGKSAREASGDLTRRTMRPVLGDAAEQISDAEALDTVIYTVFPNFHPWGTYQRVVYRFRPNGDDHRSCLMDVMLLAPVVGERPRPAPVVRLTADQRWTDAPELGSTARIFDQDSYNMPRVQEGLESTRATTIPLARYQESKIRHFHHLLEQWVGE